MQPYPLQLSAVLKDAIWGGTRLITDFHKHASGERAAESWELSCHPDGPCTVLNGPLAGKTLAKALCAFGPGALGQRAKELPAFPLLVKLIDAAKPLSIQVHPDDEWARREEGGSGKTEMWYVVDCLPDSFLYVGFRREVSEQEVRQRIADGALEEALNKIPVQPGDAFFLPAGMVHAIGAGILLAEVQQNSNITYRVYDYNRIGADGKPRALHVEKALAVMDRRPAPLLSPGRPQAVPGGVHTPLFSCPAFTACLYTAEGELALPSDAGSFVHLLALQGAGRLLCGKQSLPFHKGDSLFLPCGLPSCKIHGDAVLLASSV